MDHFFKGNFGRSASQEFARKIHMDRIHGKLPDISAKEEKQMVDKFIDSFGEKAYKVRQVDIEREVLNPLRIRHDDMWDQKEVNELDKDLGLKDHTNRIEEKHFGGQKHDEFAENDLKNT